MLAEVARSQGVLTIGIGDGGNEVGFGAVRQEIAESLPSAGRCLNGCPSGVVTVITTDIMVSASVSNWGAYAVAAALAVLRREPTCCIRRISSGNSLRPAWPPALATGQRSQPSCSSTASTALAILPSSDYFGASSQPVPCHKSSIARRAVAQKYKVHRRKWKVTPGAHRSSDNDSATVWQCLPLRSRRSALLFFHGLYFGDNSFPCLPFSMPKVCRRRLEPHLCSRTSGSPSPKAIALA